MSNKQRDSKSIKYELIGASFIALLLLIIGIVGIYSDGISPSGVEIFYTGGANIKAPLEAYIMPGIMACAQILFIILLLLKNKLAWIMGILAGIVLLPGDILNLVIGIGLIVESINYHKACKNEL